MALIITMIDDVAPDVAIDITLAIDGDEHVMYIIGLLSARYMLVGVEQTERATGVIAITVPFGADDIDVNPAIAAVPA